MAMDQKEKNLLKFFVKGLLIPFVIVYWTLRRAGPYLAKGGPIGASLAQIGALYVILNCIKLFRNLFVFLKRKQKNVLEYGKWAIVTGATSGIGQAYAFEFASSGMNICIISRSESKLQETKRSILEKYPNVNVDYIIRDFSDSNENSVRIFEKTLHSNLKKYSSDGGIGVLVNAVGMSNDIPARLHETDKESIRQMLYINNNGTALMTHSVLPHMVERKSGAIIVVSSGSGRNHATPMLATYSATKAFGSQLARSMFYEYKEHGIDCLSITPYYFISGMFRRKKSSFFLP